MQLDGVQGKADPDRVADRKAAGAGQASNLQLVGRKVEAQRAAAGENHLPRLVLRAESRLPKKFLELEIVQIDRGQNAADPDQNAEYR